MLSGKIIKGIGGFYYVESNGNLYECRAKGSFKQKNISLLAGDNVKISGSNEDYRIEEREPRKNFLKRPAVANIDLLIIVSSTVCPDLNPNLIDRMIAIAEYKKIKTIIAFTKIDLNKDYIPYYEMYNSIGYKTIACNNLDGTGAAEIESLIQNKTCVLAGNTGVGKSSLLNAINPVFNAAVGETSKKLGRGKHTPRENSLYKFSNGYIVDTPGFSSLENFETIYKEELPYCFREFTPYIENCKFKTCSHTKEDGCAVIKAVKDDKISESRYKSYIQMYNEVRDIKAWEK